MLVIRYLRIGRKNQPSFKIVVTDKRKSTRTGSFVEVLGFYNPLTKKKGIKKDRVQYWMSKGAKPSPTVYNLLIGEKIIESKKIAVHKKRKIKEGEKSAAPAPEKAKKVEEKIEVPIVPAPVVVPTVEAPAPALVEEEKKA